MTISYVLNYYRNVDDKFHPVAFGLDRQDKVELAGRGQCGMASWGWGGRGRIWQSQFIFNKIAGQKTINETNVENQQRNGGKSLKYLNIFKLATSKIFLLFYVFLQFFPIFFHERHHSNVVSIITYPPNI